MSVIKGMTPGLIELDPTAIKADDAGNTVPTEIEVLQAGSWNTPGHGSFSIKPEDLDQYVKNFNEGVRKGVPIDLEHKTDGGAVGWIEGLRRAGDSLYASVKWTKAGATLISDRTYRFFSPEFSPAGYKDPEGKMAADKNILIGGALTNRPLFKNLQSVAANDKSTSGLTGDGGVYIIYAEEGEPMQLDEIRKLDPAKLTADQKSFLEQHKAELSADERTKFNLVVKTEAEIKAEKDAADKVAADAKAKADADAEAAKKPVAASEGQLVTISASQLSALEESAKLGRLAHAELEHKKASDKIGGFTFNDKKFKPGGQGAITKFYLGLTDEQRTAFESDVVGNIADAALVTAGENGNAAASVIAGSAGEQLDKRANEISAADKINYSAALIKAKDENPDLAKQYQSELKQSNGEV